MRFETVDEVAVDPAAARVYAEGWQSWSPTAAYPLGAPQPRPQQEWQRAMRFRPGVALPTSGFQGEGLLVLDPGTGAPARRYAAAPGTYLVPSVRVAADDDRAVVSADGTVRATEVAGGLGPALTAYADEVVAASGLRRPRAAPRVWCTWYRYFEEITAADVRENLDALDQHDLGVDVVQIDDGWSLGLGEWLAPSPAFGPLPALVEEIRGTGRQAGIWLAPFVVGRDTSLARHHPEWLVGPPGSAGRNWGQDLVGLDLTHPGVRDYLHGLVVDLVGQGVTYLKLDFLYAGAVPGARHDDVSGVEAYRSGLQLLRDAAGAEVYLVGCGAPLLPSIGLVDAMRVSPDTFHEGGETGAHGLRGLMPLAARSWQHGRWWVGDPDCLVARPSYALREAWAEAFAAYGGLRSFSDRIAELDDWGLDTVRTVFADPPEPRPLPAAVVERGLGASAVLAEGLR